MARSELHQDRQVKQSDAYVDTLTIGPGLEANAEDLQDDLNALRSLLRRLVRGVRSGNWYDDIVAAGIPGLQDAFYDFLLENDPDFEDVTYAPTYSGLQLSTETWVSTAGSVLIKQCAYTYSGLFVSTAVCQVYDPTGITVVAQTTTTFNWSSGRLASSTLTRDV